MRTTVADYIEAFQRHYPTHSVRVRWRSRENAYAVYINGDHGGMLLTETELQEATRMFNR